MIKTARHVNVVPNELISSRSNILNLVAKMPFASSIIGNGNLQLQLVFPYACISDIHFKCDSVVSIDKAIGLTFRFVNSESNSATRANSVVHTGVKSAGCENSIPQLKTQRSFINSMNPNVGTVI